MFFSKRSARIGDQALERWDESVSQCMSEALQGFRAYLAVIEYTGLCSRHLHAPW